MLDVAAGEDRRAVTVESPGKAQPDLVDFLLADPADADVLVEACRRYGEDYERELADLAAGLHPAQR